MGFLWVLEFPPTLQKGRLIDHRWDWAREWLFVISVNLTNKRSREADACFMWPTISIMHKMLLTWNLCSCSSWNHVQHNCHRWVPLRLRFVLFLLIYCGLFKTCCTCNFTTWLFRQGCVYSQRGSCEGNKNKQKHVNCLFESFSVLKVDIFWIQLARWISCLAIEAKMTLQIWY